MSARSESRNRVAEHPRTISGLVGGVVVTIGLLVALRFAAGALFNDPVHPVTYLGVAGGGFGATAMLAVSQRLLDRRRFAPIDFWARTVGEGEPSECREQGYYLHITYGALIGGFLPRTVQELAGGGAGPIFAEYPMSLVTGAVYGLVLFVLGLVYGLVGFFRLETDARSLLEFLSLHLVYGLVLGLVLGLASQLL